MGTSIDGAIRSAERDMAAARESIVLERAKEDARPDVITPVEPPVPGPLGRLARQLFPVLDRPSKEHVRESYRRRSSFTDELPYGEYLPDEEAIAFVDNKTLMAVYSLSTVPTEGRSIDMLRGIVRDLVPVLSGVVPGYDNDPWVMGIYGDFNQRIKGGIEVMRDYAKPRARDRYFEDYIERMEEHYQDVTRPGGYFHDDIVTDTPWGGQSQNVRLVIYRRYARTKPKTNPSSELDLVCSKLETTLAAMKVDAERLDGRAFYEWIRDWLNPNPAACGGDPRRLDEVAPYPGDDDMPVGAAFAESLCLKPPRVDQRSGVWYFDDMPHVVLQMETITDPPLPGALTGELERYERRYTTVDELPPGTIIALNIIFRSQKTVQGDVEKVRNASRGDGVSAKETRIETSAVLRHLDATHEPLYPAELAFYVRAPNMKRLHEHVSEATQVLLRNGIRVMDPFLETDPVRAGNFLRNFPGVMRASIDEKAARRARLVHANHLMRLAPLYGRSRGTGRPGTGVMWNRSGEPLFWDLLSPEETQLNGHAFFYGQSGSGKSALLNVMLDTAMAMYNPRIVILDLGGSFDHLGRHARAMGRSVHTISMTMNDDISIPPFADALQLVGRAAEVEAPESDDMIALDVKEFAKGDSAAERKDKKEAPRDILGQLEIMARLMVSCVTGKEIESPTLKVAIRRAITLSAERAASGKLETRVPRPIDIADALKELAMRPENSSREGEIIDIANAVYLFCDGLNGHVFNREGQPWPEVDLTILDMAEAGQSGREETMIMAVVSLVMHLHRIAERDQYTGRPIIFLVDEAHMVTGQELLMILLIKITKMWRKLNARLWLATQEIEDIPQPVKRMIGMMENWVAMSMTKQQAELTAEFRPITPEQMAMMLQCRMYKGVYSEGTLIKRDTALQFRSVPPSKTLAMAMTDPKEKEEQARLKAEHGIGDEEVVDLLAKQIRDGRLSAQPKRRAVKRRKKKTPGKRSEERADGETV